MGKHYHRYGINPQKSKRTGLCIYYAPGDKSRRWEIWKNRIRQHLAFARKTSPYQFYKFWLNAGDTDAQKWIRLFTFLDRSIIESIEKAHAENPSQRVLQKRLAEEITTYVHGADALCSAQLTTEKLFAQQSAPAESLSRADLLAIEGVLTCPISRDQLAQGLDVVSFLANSGVLPSKGEARKLVQAGGISINRKKIDQVDARIDTALLLHNEFILVQKGKKTYFLVQAN